MYLCGFVCSMFVAGANKVKGSMNILMNRNQ